MNDDPRLRLSTVLINLLNEYESISVQSWHGVVGPFLPSLVNGGKRKSHSLSQKICLATAKLLAFAKLPEDESSKVIELANLIRELLGEFADATVAQHSPALSTQALRNDEQAGEQIVTTVLLLTSRCTNGSPWLQKVGTQLAADLVAMVTRLVDRAIRLTTQSTSDDASQPDDPVSIPFLCGCIEGLAGASASDTTLYTLTVPAPAEADMPGAAEATSAPLSGLSADQRAALGETLESYVATLCENADDSASRLRAGMAMRALTRTLTAHGYSLPALVECREQTSKRGVRSASTGAGATHATADQLCSLALPFVTEAWALRRRASAGFLFRAAVAAVLSAALASYKCRPQAVTLLTKVTRALRANRTAVAHRLATADTTSNQTFSLNAASLTAAVALLAVAETNQSRQLRALDGTRDFVASLVRGRASADATARASSALASALLLAPPSVTASFLPSMTDAFFRAHDVFSSEWQEAQGDEDDEDEDGGPQSTGSASAGDGRADRLRDVADRAVLRLSPLLSCLGTASVGLKEDAIVAELIRPLISRVETPLTTVDALILDQLAVIGSSRRAGRAGYEEVATFMCDIYARAANDTRSSHEVTEDVVASAAGSLLRLADGLPPALLSDLTVRLCRLLTSMSQRSIAPASLRGIRLLIHPIGKLLAAMGPDAVQHPHFVKYARQMWFAVVVLAPSASAGPGELRSGRDWVSGINLLAQHLPPLAPGTPHAWLETQAEVETALAIEPTAESRSRDKLSKALAAASVTTVRASSAPHVVFAFAVLKLELRRAARLRSFSSIFAYLQDPALSDMSSVLRALADRITKQLIVLLREQGTNSDREAVLAREATFLLARFCHKDENVRRAADTYITQLLGAFPHTLWKSGALFTLLDLADEVGRSCAVAPAAASMSMRAETPSSSAAARLRIQFPEEENSRRTLLNDVIRLAREWLKHAREAAPQKTESLLQGYAFSVVERWSVGAGHGPWHHRQHVGMALAVEAGGAEAAALVTRNSARLPKVVSSSSPSFMNDLHVKSAVSGEIRGMLLLLEQFEDAKSRSATLRRLAGILVSKFHRLVHAAEDDKASVSMASFSEVMHSATAFLVSEHAALVDTRELVHMISWTPALLFSRESMRTGTFCWSWIASDQPALALPLLVEVSAAWRFVIDSGLGLFDGGRPSPEASLTVGTPLESKALPAPDVVPHEIWLHWLREHTVVWRDADKQLGRVLLDIAHRTVAERARLSLHASALGARLRLLSWCFSFVPVVPDQFSALIFRERVYLAGLAWFEQRPTWYEGRSRAELERDIEELRRLCTALARDSFSTVADAPTADRLHHMRDVLLLLLDHETERVCLWNNPLNRTDLPRLSDYVKVSACQKMARPSTAKTMLRHALAISPALAGRMAARFPSQATRDFLERTAAEAPTSLADMPDGVLWLATPDACRSDAPSLRALIDYAPARPTVALTILGPEYHSNKCVTEYAVRSLRELSAESMMFYVPQLIQCLRYDRHGILGAFLVEAGAAHELLAHQLIWATQSYTLPDESGAIDEELAPACERLVRGIEATFDEVRRAHYQKIFAFFENFTATSALLGEQFKDSRHAPTHEKDAMRNTLTERLWTRLGETPVDDVAGLAYLPTNPNSVIAGIVAEKSRVLQSAAKVPIFVTFDVAERQVEAPSTLPSAASRKGLLDSSLARSAPGTPDVARTADRRLTGAQTLPEVADAPLSPRAAAVDRAALAAQGSAVAAAPPTPTPSPAPAGRGAGPKTRRQSCIFKANDDLRQDVLALQIISYFRAAMTLVDLDVYVFPYKVIATTPGCGLIEVVPKSASRDALGKHLDGNLVDHFLATYGHDGSPAFTKARDNFIRSMAGYATISYILQTKDRHNGNILYDEEGHMVHIDYGFIFDSAPGPSWLTFEVSPFKLSGEMVSLMGGVNSEAYTHFIEQSIRAFLALREHADDLVTLAAAMAPTALPCFTPASMTNLRARFAPGVSESEAAAKMHNVTKQAYGSLGYYTTVGYDMTQKRMEGISS